MDAVNNYIAANYRSGHISHAVSSSSTGVLNFLRNLTGGRSSSCISGSFPDLTGGNSRESAGNSRGMEEGLTHNLRDFMGCNDDIEGRNSSPQSQKSSGSRRGTPVSFSRNEPFIPPPITPSEEAVSEDYEVSAERNRKEPSQERASELPGLSSGEERQAPVRRRRISEKSEPFSSSQGTSSSSTEVRSPSPRETSETPSGPSTERRRRAARRPGITSKSSCETSHASPSDSLPVSHRRPGRTARRPTASSSVTESNSTASSGKTSGAGETRRPAGRRGVRPSAAGIESEGSQEIPVSPTPRRPQRAGRPAGSPGKTPGTRRDQPEITGRQIGTETASTEGGGVSSSRPRRPGASRARIETTSTESSGAISGRPRRPGTAGDREIPVASITSPTGSSITSGSREESVSEGRGEGLPSGETSEALAGKSRRRPSSVRRPSSEEGNEVSSETDRSSLQGDSSAPPRGGDRTGTVIMGDLEVESPRTEGNDPLPYTSTDVTHTHWNGPEILGQLSQVDDVATTSEASDNNRCGAAAVLAPHILQGPDAVSRVTERLEASRIVDPQNPPEGDNRSVDQIRQDNLRYRNELRERYGDRRSFASIREDNERLRVIRGRVQSGQANYGDMCQLQDIMYRSSGGNNGLTPNQVNGLNHRVSGDGTSAAGNALHSPPASREYRHIRRDNSYVMFMDSTPTGTSDDSQDHFVTVGRDGQGHLYVYDPGQPAHQNLIREGDPRFRGYFQDDRMGRLVGERIPTY